MPHMPTATAIRRQSAPKEKRQPVRVGLFHLVCIFLICSLLGLVGETIVSYFQDGRWESRVGFVFGPFSPLYGLGAVLITVTVNPLRGHSAALQFLAAGIVGGALEYFAGWFFETHYGIVAWSYAGEPFNLHGHTSLSMCAVWGLIGVAWVMWALPATVRLAERVPQGARTSLTVIALLFIFADSAITLAAIDSWFWRMAGAPIEGPIQEFCAEYFPDCFMASRFETMSMWTSLASR